MKTSVHEILRELNESNSSNYKLDVLKKHKDNELFKRVLSLANDKVRYNFGIGKTTLAKFTNKQRQDKIDLDVALDFLENELATRKLTGNAALERLESLLTMCSEDNANLIEKIISRDLKINCGRTQINKVHKDLIIKPTYCRCAVYNKKTAKEISFENGAINQKKADGTYRQFNVACGETSINSRSGEDYTYPIISKEFNKFPDNIYIGEMTVKATPDTMQIIYDKLEYAKRLNHETAELEEIIAKYNNYTAEGKEYILPRSAGNGIINSDDIYKLEKDIIVELWDCISYEDYNLARLKDKKNLPKRIYKERWEELKNILETNQCENIRLIEHGEVNSLEEALEQTSVWMEEGYEGSVLKDWNMLFKDGTSAKQLKLKLEIDCEMRIGEFLPGNPGSKNEAYFSAITFYNDEDTIRGQIGVTTMTEEMRDYLWSIKDTLPGKIMSIKFNDLSRATSNHWRALSHPRFIEIRNDKDSTDTLEDVKKYRKMAMQLGSR